MLWLDRNILPFKIVISTISTYPKSKISGNGLQLADETSHFYPTIWDHQAYSLRLKGSRRVGFPRVGYLFVFFHRGAIDPRSPTLLIWGMYNLEKRHYMERTGDSPSVKENKSPTLRNLTLLEPSICGPSRSPAHLSRPPVHPACPSVGLGQRFGYM